jgi:hypothetical protein
VDTDRRRAGARSRRRWFTGLVVGLMAGAALGAALLVGASPPPPAGPSPYILHAAPAVVDSSTAVTLGATSVCARPDEDSCRIVAAAAYIRPAGAAGWSRIAGLRAEGGFRFRVPAQLVPPDGFAYWLRFTTGTGTEVAYPPGADAAPVRVLTTAGLPTRSIPGAFSWQRRRSPDGHALRVPFGATDGRVGRTPERPDEPSEGPSSFDVAADGSIWVADWVNRRIELFGRDGRYVRAFASPASVAVDLAVTPGGGTYLATLGTDATAYELDASGAVVGRYPVGFGVSARVAASGSGPRVFVGPGEWAAVSLRTGIPLTAAAQGRSSTSSVPLPDGAVGLSAPLGRSRVAVTWTRPDGSRAGAVVRLPSGVAVGAGYFVRPLPDGGAILAQGLWDETHAGVGVIRFDANARIRSFALLPEPSSRQAARFSTVRFRAPDEVLEATRTDRAYVIDRFEVK